MKTYRAQEGYLFVFGEEELGTILYTPDDFDESVLTEIPIPQKPTRGEELL